MSEETGVLRTFIREIVSTSQGPMQRQAVTCLVIAEDGTVLAVSRKDDPTDFGMPGGKVDPGETLEEAAARELLEETGLTATRLVRAFTWEDADGYTTTTFLCDVIGSIDTTEAGVVRWVAPAVLTQGRFARYNTRLLAHLGISTC